MKSMTEQQSKLIFLLIIVIILFSAYQFGYVRFIELGNELTSENENYQSQIDDLRLKAANEAMYIEITQESSENITKILDYYGSGNTPEKSILFTVALGAISDMTIPSVSFGTEENIFRYQELPESGGLPVYGYQMDLSISYRTTYAGLKRCIDYINTYRERMNIQSLSATYDAQTGNLSGNMVIRLYSVASIHNPYEVPAIGGISIGTKNIFGTLEIGR